MSLKKGVVGVFVAAACLFGDYQVPNVEYRNLLDDPEMFLSSIDLEVSGFGWSTAKADPVEHIDVPGQRLPRIGIGVTVNPSGYDSGVYFMGGSDDTVDQREEPPCDEECAKDRAIGFCKIDVYRESTAAITMMRLMQASALVSCTKVPTGYGKAACAILGTGAAEAYIAIIEGLREIDLVKCETPD